ncbi:MAG: hypothetical protein ACFCVC_20140 [Acidimicrobiia bacterium]
MTALEERLIAALLAGAGATTPAPDLFARVRGSIEDDLARRRIRLRAVAVLGLVSGSFAALAVGMSVNVNGRLVMPWWVMELLTTMVLIGMALWLGPFIKRFGRAYAADVFRANPRTGKSFIVLTDIVYYLIFAAYILFTVRFSAAEGWGSQVGPEQIQWSVFKLGGILLIIGVLHGLNIMVMPVLGRLFSLNRRLDALNRSDGVDE